MKYSTISIILKNGKIITIPCDEYNTHANNPNMSLFNDCHFVGSVNEEAIVGFLLDIDDNPIKVSE